MKRFFFALFSFVISLGSLLAQQNDSINILFIGNSFTYYNDLPAMVQKLGESQNVKIGYAQCTPGGQSFAGHLKMDTLMNLIKQGKWDYVVMQEQSSRPSLSTQSVLKSTYKPAAALDSIVQVYNPNAQRIFYMTWGHKDGNVKKDGKTYPLSNTYKGMQYRLISTYLEMSYKQNAWCAPVGIAWMKVREEKSDIELYHKDKYHPSAEGSYLAANVIFSTIYQKPYISSFTFTLPIEEAAYLQQRAQSTVLENMDLINILKK